MNLRIEKRYLKLPVSPYAQNKVLAFSRDNKLVFDFSTRLDPLHPKDFFYWDMRDYVNQTLQLETIPSLEWTASFVDEIPTSGIYTEYLRPAAHFTPRRGWMNDPNGCVFYEGQYHLFFQHNPADSCWGNMSWGHATSPDLIHWTEQPVALFPDEMGTMYSGSAIVDHNNVTGLKVNEHDPLLLFYTAAGRKSLLSQQQDFCQCMAYSTDGGNTFHKYAGNPVVPHIVSENRDPKVLYVPEAGCWYMALYLTENEYILLKSNNLLDWEKCQRILLPGDGECPDFFPLTCQGETYYIFIGASDRYLVGKMAEGQFLPVQEARSLQARGRSYAAQSFSNVPGGRRLRMAWNQTNIPDSGFTCAMCTPTEMTLTKDAGGFWLHNEPMEELNCLHGSNAAALLSGKAQDIRIRLDWQQHSVIKLQLLGLTITLSRKTDSLTVKDVIMPLHTRDGITDLRLITDVHAVELYTGQGRSFTCIDHMADYNLNTLMLSAENNPITPAKLTIWELKTIWNG